jgi:hypothetical protein
MVGDVAEGSNGRLMVIPKTVIAVALTSMLAAGCSTARSAPKPSTQNLGTVTGVASPCWPYAFNAGIKKAPVEVSVLQNGRIVVSQTVRGSHVYRFQLTPSSYVVSTPYSKAVPIAITAGRTVKVDLPDDCV